MSLIVKEKGSGFNLYNPDYCPKLIVKFLDYEEPITFENVTFSDNGSNLYVWSQCEIEGIQHYIAFYINLETNEITDAYTSHYPY